MQTPRAAQPLHSLGSPAASEPRRRGVDSVRMAGRILQAMLQFNGPARLKDIEKATGIASATLHRYLISLIACGLAQKADGSNRYTFGLLAHQIGLRAGRGNDLVTMLAPAVRQLSEQIGETCAIGVWLEKGAVIVEWFESSKPISVSLRAGQRLPLLTSSTAQALAAWLPEESTRPHLLAELQAQGNQGAVGHEDFYRRMAKIRKDGFVRGLGTQVKGIRSLSVPVFQVGSGVVAALSVIGSEANFKADIRSPAGQALMEVGRRLSGFLGGAESAVGA
jgi:DNA-binding IclR family transcriptional regulator